MEIFLPAPTHTKCLIVLLMVRRRAPHPRLVSPLHYPLLVLPTTETVERLELTDETDWFAHSILSQLLAGQLSVRVFGSWKARIVAIL